MVEKDFDKKIVEKVIEQLSDQRNSSLHSYSSCYNIEDEKFFEDLCQSSNPQVAEVANQGLQLIRSNQLF